MWYKGHSFTGLRVNEQNYGVLIQSARWFLRLNSENSSYRIQFLNLGVKFLGSLSHPNLLKLLGYCREGKLLFLVYEFMQRGSLKNHLFGRHSGVGRLSWEIRAKIAVGAVHGLSYPRELEKQTIYRDFRTSYILLDPFYNAKISDFGLAKMSPADCETYLMTRIPGEYGYAAPEYVATGHLSAKSDVHSFGIVLLEILTSQHVFDPGWPRGQENLLEWIKPYLCDGRMLKKIMDPCLEGKYPLKAALLIAQLALACIAAEPMLRLSIKEVWNALEQVEAIKERPKKPTVHPVNTNRRPELLGANHRLPKPRWSQPPLASMEWLA